MPRRVVPGATTPHHRHVGAQHAAPGSGITCQLLGSLFPETPCACDGQYFQAWVFVQVRAQHAAPLPIRVHPGPFLGGQKYNHATKLGMEKPVGADPHVDPRLHHRHEWHICAPKPGIFSKKWPKRKFSSPKITDSHYAKNKVTPRPKVEKPGGYCNRYQFANESQQDRCISLL